jgi:aminoglycoside phosphotransferase (APT) family kinase protein
MPGRNADLNEPRPDQAERLAAFLRALHRPGPADAPLNPYRGGSLRYRDEQIVERVRRLERETTLINADVLRVYQDALQAPLDVEPTWLHGDLHGGNLLVDDDGVITGVIDWGDMTRGDCATDLATLWMNLGDRKARENAVRACNGVSDATWRRAKGWAVFFGVTLGTSGLAGDQRHAVMAQRTLERVVAGP